LAAEALSRAPYDTSSDGPLAFVSSAARFNQTVLALNLPKVLGYLMTFAMIGLFVSIFTSLYLLPPAPAGTSRWKKAMMVFQWFLSPLVAIPLGAFPMIDAQTRMFFGKYMEFWVTEKIRRG
jgi:hypothetical protein